MPLLTAELSGAAKQEETLDEIIEKANGMTTDILVEK